MTMKRLTIYILILLSTVLTVSILYISSAIGIDQQWTVLIAASVLQAIMMLNIIKIEV